MQVEIDLGNGFIDIGTQQLLSVPYAIYAGTSGSSTPGPQGPAGMFSIGGSCSYQDGDVTVVGTLRWKVEGPRAVLECNPAG